MKTKKQKNIYLASIIAILLISAIVFARFLFKDKIITISTKNDALASAACKNYKEYREKYKNKKAKSDYNKIKKLKRDNLSLFNYWKATCDAHKSDSKDQFAKLPADIQEMCRQYYSYKGHKKYLSLKSKCKKSNDDNNDDNNNNNNNNNNNGGGGSNTPPASFSCGTSTVQDADGNIYNTVLVNDQCWMAKNMNVGTKLASGSALPTNNGIIEKWCYDNSDANCTSDGGLYHWDEAMQYSTASGAQGICPTGWHIPTDAQLYALENYLKDDSQLCISTRSDWGCATAGAKLQSGGSSGMNFPPAGMYETEDSSFHGRKYYTLVWSSSKSEEDVLARYLENLSNPTMVFRATYNKTRGFSVRCIKD